MSLDCIVFDCDGVILESVEAKTRAFGRTVEAHGGEAVERLVEYHLAHGGVSRYEKFRWFHREVLGRDITQEEMDELSNRFTELCFEEVLSAPFVPGAMEFIEHHFGTVPMHVASGTPHEELETIFRERGLDRYFELIKGTPPPKAELLAGVVQETGADPKKTLMVGDSSTDLEAAEEVGTLFFGRGESFVESGYPWGHDLTGLAKHVARL